MNKSYQYLNIDVNKKIYRRLRAIQGDDKSRYILVNLHENSKAFDLSNCSVQVFGIKADEKIFFNYATIIDAVNGQFEIELTSQALAVKGELEIQILVLGLNQEKLTTYAFFIDIDKSIIDYRSIQSSDEFGVLIDSLSKVNEWNSYFEETSGEIEKKYTEKLNSIDLQLKENTNILDKKESKDKLAYKKILHNLPLKFPNYDYIVNYNGCEYMYPQSFAVEGDEIFILYAPGGNTTLQNRWVAVYNKNNNEYIGCFSAGLVGFEGLEVIKEDNRRYLYAKHEGTKLGKYDITTLPVNCEILNPFKTFEVGLYFDFSYSNGKWLIEQSGATVGGKARRNILGLYDDDFNNLGYITTNLKDVGFWESSETYKNMIPKRQGLSLCGDVFYQATGGYWGDEIPQNTPYCYQGIKIFNLDGSLKEECLLNPLKMKNKLVENNVSCSRVEYEGVKVVDNKLLSLVVVLSRFDQKASSEGVLIFEEMRVDDGINFSECKTEYSPFDANKLQTGIYPRIKSEGGLYNFVTGEKLNSIQEIINYMSETDLMNFSFYSSSAQIKDLDNNQIESGILVTIKNANNLTFFMDYIGDNDNITKFILYKSNDAYVQKNISNHKTHELELLNGVTPYYTNKNVLVKKDNNIVTITGIVTNVKEGSVIIANLPEVYRPRHNLSFIVALSASTSGGYGVITIQPDGDIEVVYRSSKVEYICLNNISYVI